jgi:thiol-disulfide isomerase/thioredoxin
MLAVVCGTVGQVLADDAKQREEKTPPAASSAENLKASPDDNAALNTFMNEGVQSIFSLAEKDPDAAEKKLAEMQAVLSALKTTTPAAKTNVARAQAALRSFAANIELQRVSLADLETKLDAEPTDSATLTMYIRKVMQTLAPLARSEPQRAGDILDKAKQRVQKAVEAAPDEPAKRRLQSLLTPLASYERAIESGKKMIELIGKDAAPLDAEAWVNGSPLTDDDLKGKVVMLDFWAIWCGPCIATFPHLREWQERYAEKGLVIIGLTRYYNYKWDEAAGRAVRAEGIVEPEAEQEMLKQFAAHHKLSHRFAVQSKESPLSQFYGVTGIPHCVVIDQAGKIRIMRVGSNEQNAKDISEMLEKLLGPTPAGSGG